MTFPDAPKHINVIATSWKEFMWGSILNYAALLGIDRFKLFYGLMESPSEI